MASVHSCRRNQIRNGDASAQKVLFHHCFPYRGLLFRFCSAWRFLSAGPLLFSFSPCFLFRQMSDGADAPRVYFCCSRKKPGVFFGNRFRTCVRGCLRKGFQCCWNTFCIPHIFVCRKYILLRIFTQDPSQGSCSVKGRQRQRIFLAGTRVQKLIQDLQLKIIRVLWPGYFQPAHVKVIPCLFFFLKHTLANGFNRLFAQFHTRLKLVNQQNSLLKRLVFRKIFHLPDVVFIEFPAERIGFAVLISPHPLCIGAHIRPLCEHTYLQIIRRDFQIAGIIVNDAGFLRRRLQKKVDRQYFNDFDKAPILQRDDPMAYVSHRQPVFCTA